MSQNQRYGRSDYQYKEFGTDDLYKKVTETRKADTEAWNNSIKATGYTNNTLPEVFEKMELQQLQFHIGQELWEQTEFLELRQQKFR